MTKFSAQTIKALRQKIDTACADQEKGLPGAVFAVVGKDGEEKFAYASGHRGYGTSEKMTLDSIFWIASCTKVIVGIACMQLVEKGLLALDDSNQVEKLCPELKQVKVLQDDGKLVEKKRGITLRMLLDHTGKSSYRIDQYHKSLDTDERSVGSWIWIYLFQ
jgi:CubicO group peptidase (beta-lactamase class C family)